MALSRLFRSPVVAICALGLSSCSTTMPSAQLQTAVNLPVPSLPGTPPDPDRLSSDNHADSYVLTAEKLIPIAFNLQPDIKAAFQRFKSEEARYDFFVASRDSLTPRLSTSNTFEEFRENVEVDEYDSERQVTRSRYHTVELSMEKRFFDTTELDLGIGYQTDAIDDDIGNHPFVSARLRYPLWVSREKLQRTSEDIFRRNELDDAQLGYIQTTRWRLQFALFNFHGAVQLRTEIADIEAHLRDLEDVLDQLGDVVGRDTSTDHSRLEAEIASLTAEIRNKKGRYDINLARLKELCGLPFYAQVDLVTEPFNPFEGMSHEELFRASIDTDPEIATLRNAVRNAEVQLDLARRGRWDLALQLSGRSSLEGRGEHEGASDWSVSVGMDVSAVDPRVTDSLIRQAQANIARSRHAMGGRENRIFVDTLEPLVRLETIGESRTELIQNLPRYEKDYQTGVTEFLAGRLNIDDLVKRRETLADQQEEISDHTVLLGANVADLCSATGKFFELLGESDSNAPIPIED